MIVLRRAVVARPRWGGRELLRYIRSSYTTGYTLASYNRERTHEIVQEFTD